MDGRHVPHFDGGVLVDSGDGVLDGLVGDVFLVGSLRELLRLEGMVLLLDETAVAEVCLGGPG